MNRVYLLLIVAIVVVLWWKHRQRGRRVADESPPPSPPPAAGPEAMLRCVHCGLHLPASQSLPGRGGVFCSASHREQFEAKQ